jgi:hypothetical protein
MSKTAMCLTCFLVLGGLVSTAAAFDPNTDPSLLGYWTFDEGTGNVVGDSGPDGINGTVNGAPVWVTGRFGGALQFDGVDDYVDTGNTENLPKWTICCWVKSDTAPASSSPTGPLHREANYQINWNHTDSNFRNAVAMSAGGTWYSASLGTLEAQEWYHLAGSYDGENLKAYTNGKLITTNASPSGDPGAETNTLKFARHAAAAQYCAITIDEARVYRRALTAAEIASMVPPVLKATKPNPANQAIDVVLPLLQWTKGDTAVFHDVYVGTSPDLTDADKQPRAYGPALYYAAGLTPGVQYYWRVDEVEGNGTVHTGDLWTFTAMPLTAYLPQPADGGADVFLTPTLSWAAGQMATAHHVYFGTDRQAVADGATETDQGSLGAAVTSYKPAEELKPDTTYFWRVDETSSGTIQTGPVWSFSTVLPGPVGAVRQWWLNIGSGTAVADLTSSANYPDNPTGTEVVIQMEGPTDWENNYGTRLYGWLYPPESGDYTFWIASDDNGELLLSTDEDPANKRSIATVTSWTASEEWGKETNQRSQSVTLEAGKRYYIEALQKEGGGGDNVAVAWQGPGFNLEVLGEGGVGPTPYLPQKAYSPSPANGAVDTAQSVVLSWSAGEKALKHEVYFGDDANAVAAADPSSDLFKGSQSGTTYDVGALEWGKTFYWRVNEINEGEAESPWVGRVWSFTTADFIAVDDFESYDDAEGTGRRIYETWIDGYTDGLSGSVVGNFDPPFAEQTIVHGGAQSMPMDYDNSNSPYFSQAYREFSPAMNWTVNDVTDLSLWVRGNPAPVADVTENAGQMTVSGAGADIWGTADQFTFVYKTLNGDGSLVARVVNIGSGTNTWAKGGVMIRDSLDAGSASAQMFLTANTDGTAGNGGAFQNRATADLDMNANDATSNTTLTTAIAPPYYVKIERVGDTLSGSISPDGKTWTQVGVSQYIAMEAPAYIGICVTSHAAGQYRTFEFDNVKATGATGAWQTEEVGLTRNSQQPLYVIVEDSSGKQATAVDPNAAAVNATTWTEWKIPLSDLAGVNLTKVKTLYVGVGDPAQPAADGTGRIYIDDIRVTRPAPAPVEP